MKDGAKLAGLLVVLVAIVAAVALGWFLTWRNYQECRAHGFSRLYCWSQEQRQ